MSDVRTNWDDWPCCAQCGQPRHTVCPTCGHAGCQFLLAEYQALPAPTQSTRRADAGDDPAARTEHDAWPAGSSPAPLALLMCAQCDEAFTPRFYRICPACGHDAGSGILLRSAGRQPVSSRVLLAIYGLLAILALVLGYFWFLLCA